MSGKHRIKWVIILLCLVIAGLALALIPRHGEPAALIDGVKFRMRPSEVHTLLSKPDAETESDVSPTLYDTYESVYAGVPAEVHFRYIRVRLHYELYEVSIRCGTDDSARIAARMTEQLRSAYGSLDGYYEEAAPEGMRLGVSMGAEAISGSVETDADGVRALLSFVY